jgi:hypothetical protein
MNKKHLFNLRMTPSRRVAFIFILLTCFGVALTQANDPQRVGLVVVHGNGEVMKQCIEFSEDQITGYEVLERSGLDLNADVTSGMGATICRIDDEGCTYPAEDCFCQCQGSPCIFWSYWHLVDGAWQFSNLGATIYQVSDGDVEGWVWGAGSRGNGGSPPPLIPFDQICQPLSTDTPTPTDTPTHTPEPQPTNTSTPVPAPIIHYFTAEPPTVDAGERVVLSWNLTNAKAAYLRYNGLEEGVVSPGSKTVSPALTTVYTLVTRNEGGETIAEVTIMVNATPLTPTPISLSASNPTVLPPTETSIPEPVINFNAGSSTVPPGACTSLSWEVQQASTVYLDGVEVDAQGFQTVCPAGGTQVYTLRAVYPGGERTAQVKLDAVEVMVTGENTPASTATATATVGPVTLPTQPLPEATFVSQQALSTVESRPIKRSQSADESPDTERDWSVWARLGVWGSLVGGWCLIVTVVVIVWGGIWWINSHSQTTRS